ncbi:hypothetical protein TNCV_46311 [Trichonephila clavipes]|nr:hypothetical protein TNCV_46311 [Trichonephila clavipes]
MKDLKTPGKNDALKERMEMNSTVSIVHCQYIDKVHEKLKTIRPSLVNQHVSALLNDNARLHTLYKTKTRLNHLKYEIFHISSFIGPFTNPHSDFIPLEQILPSKQNETKDSMKTYILEINYSKDQNLFKAGIYA